MTDPRMTRAEWARLHAPPAAVEPLPASAPLHADWWSRLGRWLDRAMMALGLWRKR